MIPDLEFQRQAARDGSVIRRRHDQNVVVPRDFTGRVVDPSGSFLFFAGMPIPLDDRESSTASTGTPDGYDPFPGEEAPAAPTPPKGRRAPHPRRSRATSGRVTARRIA